MASTLQAIGQRLQDAQTRIIEASTEEVERRVAHALLRLAQQAGRKIERGIEIDFPISRQDIAEMTGTTLHTVQPHPQRLGKARLGGEQPPAHRHSRCASALRRRRGTA